MLARHALAAAALLATAPGNALSQDAPPIAAFREWAKTNVFPVSISDRGARVNDLAGFGAIVGNARIVALGEPIHGGREPLSLRNRMIRYLVTEKGFTAIALETELALSHRLYDHVLGTTTESDSVVGASFSATYGRYPENLELVRWLRAYNAGRPANRRVRLYGIDLPDVRSPGSGAAALAPVLAYLDRVDSAQGVETREGFKTILPLFDGRRYAALPVSERDRVSTAVHDLVALMRRGRIKYAAASSRDAYEWALRQAINAEQYEAMARLMPLELWRQWDQGPDSIRLDLKPSQTARSVAMAENIAWALEREGPRGRIVFFAHNAHLQRQALEFEASDPLAFLRGWERAGRFLDATFGADLVTIGMYYGQFNGPEPADTTRKPGSTDMGGLLGSLALPAYAFDLRKLSPSGPLRAWLQRSRATHFYYGDEVVADDGGSWLVSPLRSFDAVVYIERITPARLSR